MNIQEILRKERAPKEKAVEKAKVAHEKAATTAKKAEAAAKASYDAKCAEAKKIVDTAAAELATAESGLVEFDAQVKSYLSGEGAAPKKAGKPGPKPGSKAAKAAPKTTPAPKGKPGPKPGSKKAAPAPKAAPKGKPGPKPGSKKAAKAAPKTPKAVAARPPIKDGIRLVLGRKTLSLKDIFSELTARKWVPESNNPAGYVAAVVSSTKNVFESTGRGVYRVKADAPPIKPEVKAQFGDAVKAEPQATQAASPKAPKAAAAPTEEKHGQHKHGQHKCKTCLEPGHNAKGHDKAMAKKAEAEKAEPKAEKAEPKAEKAEPKAEPVAAPKVKVVGKSVDSILAAEAVGLSAEMENAFG